MLCLQAAFWIFDAVAHFTHYRYGETASAWIWHEEHRFPVLRPVIGAALIVLFSHLLFQFP